MTQPQSPPEGTGRVRPAVATDLPVVEWIERTSFTEPWPSGAFRQYLDATVFFVYEHPRGPIAGFIIGDSLGPQSGGVGHIKDFAVAPQYRRQGVGRKLLGRALATFATRGLQTVTLEVRASNTAAQRLYQEFGFEMVRREAGYYRDGEDAFVMVADLGAAGPVQ